RLDRPDGGDAAHRRRPPAAPLIGSPPAVPPRGVTPLSLATSSASLPRGRSDRRDPRLGEVGRGGPRILCATGAQRARRSRVRMPPLAPTIATAVVITVVMTQRRC